MELRLCIDCRQIAAPSTIRCTRCGGQILLTDESALIGTQLGRYALAEVIGVGGMGIVFAAEHTSLRRPVALKLLLPELGHSDFLERFRREAQMLAELRHPHIVEIFDFDISEFGVPYYVMERLEGMPLSLAMLRHGVALGLHELAPLLMPVARALDYAHARGVVHRDLKPENIFLTRTDQGLHVKLLDFGIAKKVGDEALHERLTITGTVMGTPLYLTPEQLTGEPVVPATDQYALALIVAELLLGHPVRQGQSITQILRQAIQQALPDSLLGEALPASTRNAMQRATAAHPEGRFETVLDFVEALSLPPSGEGVNWLDAMGFFNNDARVAVSAVAATTPPPARVDARTPRPTDPTAALPLSGGSTERVFSARTQPLRRLRWWGVGALALLLLVAASWLLYSQSELRSASAPTAASMLREILRVQTPPDAGALVGISSAGAVLRTAGGVYLQPLEAGREATRRSVAGEEVVAVTESGSLVLMRGSMLYLVDPKGAHDEALFELPADARLLAARRDGRVFAYFLDEHIVWREAAGAPQSLASIPGRLPHGLRLGETQLLVILQQPNEAQLFDLQTGTKIWSALLRTGKIYDLAWSEDAERLAVCGFSQQVELFDLRTPAPAQNIAVDSACYAARWLPQGPSLVLRASNEIVMWRDAERVRLSWPLPAATPGIALPSWQFHAGSLLLAEPQSALLVRFSLEGLRLQALNTQAFGETWDLSNDAGVIYAAGADGALRRVDADASKEFRVHDNGITDIVAGATHLATASDDRTLAVWRKSDMAVTWRARGHEFLINQMWLAPDESALWSSSSDGSLKRWRWPELELEESIDLRALTAKPKLALHALWFSADQQQALVGSWNQELVALRRRDGRWQANTQKVQSAGGYRMLGLQELNAVVILGIQPTRVYLWDLATSRMQPLPDFGLDLLALAQGSGAQSVFAAGQGQMIQWQIRRNERADLEASAEVVNLDGLGTVGAASRDSAQQGWILGNGDGQLFRVPWSAFAAPPTH